MYKIHMEKQNLKIKPYNQHIRTWWRVMLLAAATLAVGLLTGSCGAMKHTPTNTSTEVHVKDSTVFHIKDSIRITEATRYKDMAWLGDSLIIEGQRSRAWAIADTLKGCLIGGLEEDKVEEKTRIIYKDRLVLKDSLVYVEKPVPVEIVKEKKIYPRWLVLLSTLGILLTCLEGFRLYIRLKKKLPLV